MEHESFRSAALSFHEFYLALLEAGFTPDQAMDILLVRITPMEIS